MTQKERKEIFKDFTFKKQNLDDNKNEKGDKANE